MERKQITCGLSLFSSPSCSPFPGPPPARGRGRGVLLLGPPAPRAHTRLQYCVQLGQGVLEQVSQWKAGRCWEAVTEATGTGRF